MFNLEIKFIHQEDKNYFFADVLVKKRGVKDISIFINIIKCLKEYYKKKFNNQKQDDEINFIEKILENKYFFMSLKLLARQNLLEKFLSFEENLINYDLLNKCFFKIIAKLYHSKTLKLLFDCKGETINFFMEQSFKDNNLNLLVKNLYNQNLLEKFFEILKNNPELLKEAIKENDLNDYNPKNNIDLSSVERVDKLNISTLNSL